MKITDGTGTGFEVKVDGDNRIHTLSTTLSVQQHATLEQDSFNVNSGLIVLTAATEAGILYLKNNETRKLQVSGVVVFMGPGASADAADTTHIRVYKNVTTGTLVSDGRTIGNDGSIIKSNRDFGSASVLLADAYRGGTANTITDGTPHIESLVSPGNRVFFGLDEVLREGDSIAVSVQPNTSTTSMKCGAAILCNRLDEDTEVN